MSKLVLACVAVFSLLAPVGEVHAAWPAKWKGSTTLAGAGKAETHQARTRAGVSMTIKIFPRRKSDGNVVVLVLGSKATEANVAPVVDLLQRAGVGVVLYWPSDSCKGRCVFPSIVGRSGQDWNILNAVITWAHKRTGARLDLFGIQGGSSLALRAVKTRSAALASVLVDDPGTPKVAGLRKVTEVDNGFDAVHVFGDPGKPQISNTGGAVRVVSRAVPVRLGTASAATVVADGRYRQQLADLYSWSFGVE